MIGAYFKKVFGGDKEVPANEQFYSPLRIALHSTLSLSMVDWLGCMLELNKSMKMPFGKLTVLAIGTTVADDTKIFNIYLIDEKFEEFTLQLFCSPNDKGDGMEVREATVYREVRNVTPLTEDDWTAEMRSVGNPTFTLDGLEYKRVWAEDQVGKIDLIQFDEDIIRTNESLHYTNNYVLYSRDLESPAGRDHSELLMVGVEETSDTAELVNRIGLNIPPSAIVVQ